MHPETRHVEKMKPSTEPWVQNADAVPDADPDRSQQFYLRWNNFRSNLSDVFQQLLHSESYADVTLACDGRSIKAHKVVLSASSPYFKNLFAENPCHHPIIIICDIKWPELKAVVDFMYRGEINVSQEQIDPLLKAAESLKIRGLANVNNELDEMEASRSNIKLDNVTTELKKEDESVTVSDVENIVENQQGEILHNLQSSPVKKRKRVSANAEVSEVTSPKILALPSMHVIDVDDATATPIKAAYADKSNLSDSNKARAPTWSQAQLNEAIDAVVQQKMRFTRASTLYGIPKGTLYDNILGKSKRMLVLQEADLCDSEERAVLEYCCKISASPFNRRTHCSLADVLEFVQKLRRARDPGFTFTGLAGFRWWWAFCKKHSIVSLYYKDEGVVVQTDGGHSKLRS